jgi:TolB-like protein
MAMAIAFPLGSGRRALLAGARMLAVAACLAGALGCARAKGGGDRRVIVMDFQNMIQEEQSSRLGVTLADLLTDNLSKHPRIAVVDRQNMPSLNGLGWREAGRRADVDYVIVGSLSKLEANYIVSIRLLSMVTGEVVKNSSIERACNHKEDLYPLVMAMGNVMAGNLKILSERYEAWQQR